MANVFISGSEDNKDIAKEVSNALEHKGISTWVDVKDATPGTRWVEEIERAIRDAQIYLIIVGPGHRPTRFQEFAWEAALQKTWTDPGKRIVPIIIGDVDLPAFLRGWVPIRVETTSGWTHQLAAKLAEAVSFHSEFPSQNREDDTIRRQRLQQIEEIAKKLKDVAEP